MYIFHENKTLTNSYYIGFLRLKEILEMQLS